MASKALFSSTPSRSTQVANAINEAGGTAYAMSDEAALAQYAVTGALNNTFYATAETQLAKTLELANKVSPEYLAKVAVYAREEGLMKDMPALLLAVLSTRDIELTKKIFDRVCDNAKMVKNFVQIIRSGQVGRKSLGTALKRSIQNWLASRTEEQLFNAVVGNDPSLADIIKMVHPKPKNRARGAFYKYLIGKELTKAQVELLPENVQAYEKFKKRGIIGKLTGRAKVPDVPFMLLTNLSLSKDQYREVADNMSWSALRQNLNALSKHGVFDDATFTRSVAARLADADAVRAANAFPFHLFSAYKATQSNSQVPAQIANALQDAMDASLSNVPELSGNSVVAVDISLSMRDPITGDRGTATTKVSCLDAAAVMGSALLRRNPNKVTILPFSNDVVLRAGPAQARYNQYLNDDPYGNGAQVTFNSRDSVMTNAEKLGRLPNNGTNCSSVLRYLNSIDAKNIESVIYLSDNESWMDSTGRSYGPGGSGQGTETMRQWNEFKKRNPKAKLVCIDITPYTTTQAGDRPDILNVGGFSDNVFTIVDLFLRGELTREHWVGMIKKIKL